VNSGRIVQGKPTKIAKKVYPVGILLSFWGGFLVDKDFKKD
jgi:hypothetical protein